MTSATGVPVSACFSANAICSYVYLDFFMSQLLARRLQRAGKLSLNMGEKTGRTSLKIAKRCGLKKARVALARRLAVIMHAMLRDGTLFEA